MTSPRMGAQYIEEARFRRALVRVAFRRRRWAAVVREAQECVELYLKGVLRLVAVEPARIHDVSNVLKQEAGRFPPWFSAKVENLAEISAQMAADRGIAFYGDEAAGVGAQELFDESDARKAREALGLVARLCERLASEFRARNSEHSAS